METPPGLASNDQIKKFQTQGIRQDISLPNISIKIRNVDDSAIFERKKLLVNPCKKIFTQISKLNHKYSSKAIYS